jgi:AcrR family transcriptional regulator
MPTSLKPETRRRGAPHQKRSQKTVDQILAAASELLEESGFENLSTNAICKRADLTPPALYRYFPNKYAVLKELGERLMRRQNDVLTQLDWSQTSPDKLRAQIRKILQETIDVTRQVPAGVWILRALHATPALSDVRLESHRAVVTHLSKEFARISPSLDQDLTAHTLRLGAEFGYALIEMVFDEPTLKEANLLDMASDMLAQKFATLLEEPGTAKLTLDGK